MLRRLHLAALLAALLIASGPLPGAEAGRARSGAAAAQKVRSPGAARTARAQKARRAVRNPRASKAALRRAGRQRIARQRTAASAAASAARPRKIVGPRANPLKHLPKAKGERIVFGVMGGAGTDTPAQVDRLVEDLGGRIADSGHVVLTGASPGLPDRAVRGARARGGLTVGISSYRTLESHLAAGNPVDFDVLQLTELPPALRGQERPNFMGREIDNIERSDVIVIAGGRFGTLGELAIALEERRPIGVLTGSGGVAEIVKDVVRASTRAGKPPGAPVIYDRNPQRLVQRLIKAKREMDKAGVSGPLGDGFGNF
ncbi:MAG TPA: hypothetical protein VKZ63_13655 [Kofleriaceae bacterium]|nr:hypothetical protein [Kofleriaceae bacterium]